MADFPPEGLANQVFPGASYNQSDNAAWWYVDNTPLSCLFHFPDPSAKRFLPVIVMTFWYVFTERTYIFSNFLNFILHLGLITTPHAHYVHILYVIPFLMFHSSHDHVAKRSHYCIMIFLYDFGVLLYGRIPTLIFFYFLHDSTTPILPVYIEQRRPHLEKDTTRTRGVIIRKVPTVPRRTCVTPD